MPYEDFAYPTGFTIADVARLMRVELDKRVTEMGLGLSAGDIRALMNIARYDGVRQCDIAKAMNVEAMTISAYLDRLERSSFVQRRPDPSDRRARIVCISSEALEAILQVRPMLDKVYETAMLGITRRERECTEASLAIARSNLSQQRSKESGAQADRRN